MLTKLGALTVTSQHEIQKYYLLLLLQCPHEEILNIVFVAFKHSGRVLCFFGDNGDKGVCCEFSPRDDLCRFSDIGVDTSSENIKQLVATDGFHPAKYMKSQSK